MAQPKTLSTDLSQRLAQAKVLGIAYAVQSADSFRDGSMHLTLSPVGRYRNGDALDAEPMPSSKAWRNTTDEIQAETPICLRIQEPPFEIWPGRLFTVYLVPVEGGADTSAALHAERTWPP